MAPVDENVLNAIYNEIDNNLSSQSITISTFSNFGGLSLDRNSIAVYQSQYDCYIQLSKLKTQLKSCILIKFRDKITNLELAFDSETIPREVRITWEVKAF